jgi:GT2 family glycosyltransferase
MKPTIDVSVVIVSMNNLEQLNLCLKSIFNNTSLSYEVIVVAYFFSSDNLNILKKNYPKVLIILSNEIRGFSENNNLALKESKGKYCFVLNDDTYFETNVIDRLVYSIENVTNSVIVSPKILTPDGITQYSGIPPINWLDWILILFKLKSERSERKPRYIKKDGVFQTYNILGAAFLIDNQVFKSLGYFDETYFFGPEDKALSTLLNRNGYKCYVDATVNITHIGGATGGPKSRTVEATRPAERIGSILFYSEGRLIIRFILSIFVFMNSFMLYFYWKIKFLLGDKNSQYSMIANKNVCFSLFGNKSTKEIFVKYYDK